MGRSYRSYEVADSNVFTSGLKRVADTMLNTVYYDGLVQQYRSAESLRRILAVNPLLMRVCVLVIFEVATAIRLRTVRSAYHSSTAATRWSVRISAEV